MSTVDTRTEAERRYDAERDGTLYFQKPQPAAVEAEDAEIIQILTIIDGDEDGQPWDAILDYIAQA
jgi:hypothetical protein